MTDNQMTPSPDVKFQSQRRLIKHRYAAGLPEGPCNRCPHLLRTRLFQCGHAHNEMFPSPCHSSFPAPTETASDTSQRYVPEKGACHERLGTTCTAFPDWQCRAPVPGEGLSGSFVPRPPRDRSILQCILAFPACPVRRSPWIPRIPSCRPCPGTAQRASSPSPP